MGLGDKMLIKDYDLKCIDIECWNLSKYHRAYESGINDEIQFHYRTWDGDKIKELKTMKGDISDAFYLMRILSEFGFLNVTVTEETGYGINVYRIDNKKRNKILDLLFR